jgi:membrane protease YdiL (CAAX protease family)/ABC-type transport system involved in multi-copper enzyme maturation permease subunit
MKQATPQTNYPGGRSSLSPGRFSRLALKELREILRDRRTIITLVLMPLLVYPMLSLVLQRFLLDSLRPADVATGKPLLVLGFDDENQKKLFDDLLQASNLLYIKMQQDADAEHNPQSGLSKQEFGFKDVYRLDYITPAVMAQATDDTGNEPLAFDLAQMVADGKLDLGIRAKMNGYQSGLPQLGAGLEIEFLYRQGSQTSEEGLRHFSEVLHIGNQAELRLRLKQRDLPAEDYISQRVTSIKSAPLKRTNSIATLIPLILTLMTITGAVYPAIDLTAGERERGTLETLIAAPIPRMAILLSKFVAVFTVAELTALVNMIGMMITIWAFQLDRLIFDDGIQPLMIVEIMGLVSLFAAFFSAILLAITSFARSFKEAQAYLIPVMLVSMTPGLGALVPDLKLQGPLVVMPLMNMVLLARDILQGTATFGIALIAIASTCIYGLLALTLAARVFGTSAILFGNHQGWKSFVGRPRSASSEASLSGAFFCLAILFPANFLWLGVLNRIDPSQHLTRLLMMTLGTILLFAMFPVTYAVIKRIGLSSGLGLTRGRLISYPAAVLLGCSLGVLLIQIYSSVDMISDFFTNPEKENAIRKQMVQQSEQLVASWHQIGVPLVLICLSIIPAVCEEIFFRGLLFRALAAKTHVVLAVIVSGLLFGLFHILSTNLLSIDRFLPTALIGMVLAIVCYQSGSVIPGMVLHTLHNLILVSAALFQDWIVQHNLITPEQKSLPIGLVIGAVVVSGIGFVLLFVGQPRDTEAAQNL